MKKTLTMLLAFAAAALCAAAAHATGADMSTLLQPASTAAPAATALGLPQLFSPESAMALAGLGAGGMITYYQDGDVLDLTPAAAVAKGEGYLHGAALFGVAVDAVGNGVEGRFLCKVGAVVTIAKTSALAIAVGDRLFWDPVGKCVNKTAAAQACVGVATEAAANPSATVKMRLGAVTPAGT